MDIPSMAGFGSLMKWVNTFGDVSCTSFNDLSSGKILLKCLQKIMPDVMVTSTRDPWKELFAIFEEFYGCSLEKAVSLEEISSGNEEHLSRVVVLLLCVAVQSKSNEDIVSAITFLDYDTQRDIMFFIESTLAQVKSHAIVAGTFTSGVGDYLPNLESPNISLSSLSQPSSPDKNEELDLPTLAREPSDEVFPFPTPKRPFKTLRPANFYNGLDSPGGAKLLMSPAIRGKKRTVSERTTTSCTESGLLKAFTALPAKKSPSFDDEEISRLKHSIRVLERTLQMEKKLAQEYYSELCIKIHECVDLKTDYVKLERKLDCLQEMNDVQDELVHSNSNLAAAEKTLVSYKNKIDSLEEYKEKAIELESKVKSLESTLSQYEVLKLNNKKLEESVMEKSSVVKRLELQLSKATIELDTRLSHLDSLLVENREHKREIKETKNKCRELELVINQLKTKLDNRADTEVVLMQEKREMSLEIEKLQVSVGASINEVSELMAKKKKIEACVDVFKREREELLKELSTKVSETASKDFQVKSLEGIRDELESQVTVLQSTIEILEQDVAVKEAELTSKYSQISSLEASREEMEVRIQQYQSGSKILERDVTTRKAELACKDSQIKFLEDTKTELEIQIEHLKSSIRTLERDASAKEERLHKELSTKVSELSSRDFYAKSLETIKLNLEVQVEQLLSHIGTLEQDIVIKTAEIKTSNENVSSVASQNKRLVQDMEEMESQCTTAKARISEYESEIASKESSLTVLTEEYSKLESKMSSIELLLCEKQASLESMTNHASSLASQVEQLLLFTGTLEQDIITKKDAIKTSNENISSMVSQNKGLVQDMEEMESQCTTAKARISEYESEIASKESSLTVLTKEYSKLESKMSSTELLLCEKQASLESMTNHASSLASQKSDIEACCVQLEDKLKVQIEANQSCNTALSESEMKVKLLDSVKSKLEAQISHLQSKTVKLETDIITKEAKIANLLSSVESTSQERKSNQGINKESIAEYERKLESSERQIIELQQFNRALQSGQDKQVRELMLENHHLLTKQSKLYEELTALLEERRTCQTELASSKCVSALDIELTSLKREPTYGGYGSSSLSFSGGDDHFMESSSFSSAELLNKQASVDVSTESESDKIANEKARVMELKRRNRQALPHLKSSYPVEMQVKAETSTNSNERLKNEPKKKKLTNSTSFQRVNRKSSTPNDEDQVHTSPFHVRKRGRDSRFLRRVSAPPTPQTPADLSYKRKPLAMERQSMCPSLNLREFLNEPETTISSASVKQPSRVQSGTAFEVELSPPRAKGSLPKRLQENRYRRTACIKDAASSNDASSNRRETMSKSKKPAGKATKSQNGSGQRRVLRARN